MNIYVEEFKRVSGELPKFVTKKSGVLCSCVENEDVKGYKPSSKKIVNALPKVNNDYLEVVLGNIAHTLSKGHKRAEVAYCGIAAVYENSSLTLWVEGDKAHAYKIEVNKKSFPAVWEVLFK